MEVACSCQSGDVINEADDWIDDDAEIVDREWLLYGIFIDHIRIEWLWSQPTGRAQPDELGLRRIQFEAIPRHPLAHAVDETLDESTIELVLITDTDEAVIVNL